MPSPTARLLNGVPMPLLVIGPDHFIAEANLAAQELFPKADGLIGRHHGLLIRAPDLLAAVDRALHRAEASLVRLVTPSASHDRVHEVTVTPTDGGALLAFADLTEAEEMDRMRRDFVANVSHELRTPLTAISGFVETLRGAAKDDSAARERFLGIMAAEAERMNRLVRDLLHLSRVESEERNRPENRVDLAAIARSVVDSLQPLARAGDVRLCLTGAGADMALRADPDQMVQVLSNLTENAIKYGSPAGATVTVDLAREIGPRGPVLRLSVTDQGAGIDARHIPRLTERFYRVDSHRSREKGGTGLGLAIVKHIVQRHRGRLSIESEIGKGSVFSVLIPMF
ncbi:MAG: two-component sensor histidine kinase [Rhodobacteraceae bacterium]|nr:two-component sensor histidine kinase [Paracoccaceae bacterium]